MCSGCSRKGEKNMKCQYCGNEMSEGAKFCAMCGRRVTEAEPVPARRFCPSCGQEAEPGMLFCEYCGMRLPERTAPEPRPNPVPEPRPNPVPEPRPNPVPEPRPNPATNPGPKRTGRFLMDLNLMSYYKGEPTLGIAKATGTLKLYDDRLEFHKMMGNSAASMLGAVGILAAAKQAKKNGSVDVYRYQDIASVKEGRYGGVYRTIVLVMKDGQKHSFAGSLNSGKVQEAVVQISRNL